MEKLNNKIRSTKADNQFETQSVGVYGYNPALDLQKRIEATDDNHLKVAVASHLVGSPDMAARTDIANDATSTFLKCDVAGVLQVNDVGGGGGGGSVQYAIGDALGATPTGNLMIGRDGAGDAVDMLVTNSGALNTSDSTAHTELFAINTSCGALDDKITVGEDDTLLEAQQNLIYGRKDESPTGLRAVKVKEEGAVVVAEDGVRSRLDVLNSKITQGNDLTLTEAQQVLVYGEVTAGAGAGELHPLHISQSGDLQVEISGLESTGQAIMDDSLPVVIAADQTTLSTSDVNITSGSDGFLGTAQQTALYAWSGTQFRRLETDLTGATSGLAVRYLKRSPVTTSQTIAAPANGTATFTAADMSGHSRLSFYGNSTNSSDPLEVWVSDDNVTYYKDATYLPQIDFITGDFAFSIDASSAMEYVQIRQTDTSTTAFTITVKSSRR